MSQVEENTEDNFLDNIVQCILQQRGKKKPELQDDKLNKLSQEMSNMIDEFDDNIIQCKRYNEAKIHRKYEMKIASLERQIKILIDKVEAEHKARDPSKKYVEDLVHQLVLYKNENQRLKGQLIEAKSTIDELNNTVKLQKSDTFLKSKFGSLSSIHPIQSNIPTKASRNEFNLSEQVNAYVKKRQEQRRGKTEVRSSFEIFLKKIKNSLEDCPFWDFLDRIDRWSEHISRRQEHYNPERVKSNVLSSFEGQMSIFPRIESSSLKKQNKSIDRERRKKIILENKKKYYTLDPESKKKLIYKLK